MSGAPAPSAAGELKQCCAALYASEAARWLLGESLHPGGLRLTERLGSRLELAPGRCVLDVAAGGGTSALFLAERFGCQVIGVDYSAESVAEANRIASERGLAGRVRFETGDAEGLSFAAGRFDALICECAFCTFPDKVRAAQEFSRVLRTGGRVGLSDLTRVAVLPESLAGLMAWIACIGDALPLEAYVEALQSAGFLVDAPEIHDEALRELVQQVRGRLLGVELLGALKKIALPVFDFKEVRQMAAAAAAAIDRRELGYALVTGSKR